MADVSFQSLLLSHERRSDLLTEAIINSAIDIEATLGSVYAVVFMRQHDIGMDLALRIVLRQAERRNALAGRLQSEAKSMFVSRHQNLSTTAESNASIWQRK